MELFCPKTQLNFFEFQMLSSQNLLRIPNYKIFPRFPVSRSIARDVRRLSDLLYERFLSGFWLKQGKRSKDSVNWEQSGFLAHLEPQKIELIFLAEQFYFLRFARVITSFSSFQFLRKLALTVQYIFIGCKLISCQQANWMHGCNYLS